MDLEESSKESPSEQRRLNFISLLKSFRKQLMSFDCGDKHHNNYASSFSFQDEKRSLSRTYLGLNSAGDVVSFFSLSAGQIEKGDLPSASKPYLAYPVIRLGRLAVDCRYQGQGYGFETLAAVFEKYIDVIKVIGSIALVVDAYPKKVSFYKKFGFQKLNAQPNQGVSLYVMTQTLRHLIKIPTA